MLNIKRKVAKKQINDCIANILYLFIFAPLRLETNLRNKSKIQI